jgi:hypothetical protein
MTPDNDDDPIAAVIYSCQGPPACDFMPSSGDEAEAVMQKCVWCKRILIGKDGSETIIEPTRA